MDLKAITEIRWYGFWMWRCEKFSEEMDGCDWDGLVSIGSAFVLI